MPLALRLLGGIRIESDDEPVQGRAAQRRRLALLAVLGASTRATARREKLVSTLWPESSPDAGRRLLTESLHVFRRELHPEVVTGTEEVRLNLEVMRCDLVDFRAALAARDPERAVEIYGGPFLDGFGGDDVPGLAQWLDTERAAVRREYTQALEELARRAEAAGDGTAAAQWWGKLSFEDPYSARFALGLMKALERIGEHARALQFGIAFVRRLADDLGLQPPPEVVAYLDGLRRKRPEPTPEAPKREPPPGRGGALPQVSPEFEVVARLGEGEVATVYLAREPALARLVAVKVLRNELASDEVVNRRFELEARSAARIQHPSVATVFRIGQTATGRPFLVMPYVEGGTLEDRLKAAGRFSLAEVRRYVAQTAAGLGAAHRLGIVHRDVRPANLLYDRATDRVLLTDFGLVTVLETGMGRALRLTTTGDVLGNPRYASPELLQGEPVGERADVYSLGVVAFELLTGRAPFEAPTAPRMVAAHLRDAPPRVAELRGDVDPELDALIDRCLSKRPEHRPYAAEVAEALGWI